MKGIRAVVMGVVAACGMGACAGDLGPPDMTRPISKPAELADVPLCRATPQIRGKDALVFAVMDSGGLLAVDIDDVIVCVDDAAGVVSSGVNPVVHSGAKPATCTFCEGTPLPAESIRGMLPGGSPAP